MDSPRNPLLAPIASLTAELRLPKIADVNCPPSDDSGESDWAPMSEAGSSSTRPSFALFVIVPNVCCIAVGLPVVPSNPMSIDAIEPCIPRETFCSGSPS